MTQNNNLVSAAIQGIQEKKGHNIKVVDLTKIHDTICKFMVICDANFYDIDHLWEDAEVQEIPDID